MAPRGNQIQAQLGMKKSTLFGTLNTCNPKCGKMEQTCIAHSETAWAGTLLSASSWEGATAAVASASCWTTCFPVSRKSSFFESHTSRTRLWHTRENNVYKIMKRKDSLHQILPKPNVWSKQKPPDLRVLHNNSILSSLQMSRDGALRNVVVIQFVFYVLQLLPIRFTQRNLWCCISRCTMAHR